MAQDILNTGRESKFDRLLDTMKDRRFANEKMLVFTEHRDTANYLTEQLERLGFAGRVAQLHGAMDYVDRDKQVEFFRKPAEDGGAKYLIGTDAAGEGVNLQFCWLMVNYDVPWNPARLEQRMGRNPSVRAEARCCLHSEPRRVEDAGRQSDEDLARQDGDHPQRAWL